LSLVAVISANTVYPNWGKVAFGERYFPVPPPNLPHDSLLVMAGDDPMAFIVPRLDPSVRAVSIENNLVHGSQHNLLVANIRSIIREHQGPIYSVSVASRGAGIEKAYMEYGLRRERSRCLAFAPGMGETLHICPLLRVAAPHPPSGRE
jgi:hypothetical protein